MLKLYLQIITVTQVHQVFKKRIYNALGMPKYSMWEYGEQTFNYYNAFRDYYDIINSNRMK